MLRQEHAVSVAWSLADSLALGTNILLMGEHSSRPRVT